MKQSFKTFSFTFALLALLLFFAGSGYAQSSREDKDQELALMVRQIQRNVLQVAAGRPFRFKAMNESLQLTAQAVQLMSAEPEPTYREESEAVAFFNAGPLSASSTRRRGSEKTDTIISLLQQAHKKYPENHISILLQAMVVEVTQGADAANGIFETFLKESRSYSKLDEKILKWQHFQQVRRSVLNLLARRGITFDDRQKEIEITQPFENFYRHITQPDKKDVLLNWLLLGMIIFGGLFLIISSVIEYRLSGPFTRHFGFVYFCVWLAYGVWMIDLFLGLPWGLNRHITAWLILILAGLFYVQGVITRLWKNAHPHVPEGFRLCPYCKAISPNLSKTCFNCNQFIGG